MDFKLYPSCGIFIYLLIKQKFKKNIFYSLFNLKIKKNIFPLFFNYNSFKRGLKKAHLYINTKMAGKKSTKTEQTATPVTTEQTPAPVVEKKTSRKSKKETPSEEPVATPVVVETTEAEVSGEKRRREVNKESIDRDFSGLEGKINEEIEKLNQAGKKVKGIKLLRGLLKQVRTLHSDTNRVLKFKRDGVKKNVASGFLKPIHISPEMAKFTGWDASKLHTRVDATKFVCKYIKDHNLYDPEDHRNIRCDDKLRTLLKYDASKVPIDPKTNRPQELTYFRLQQYLKIHFLKDDEVAATASKKK